PCLAPRAAVSVECPAGSRTEPAPHGTPMRASRRFIVFLSLSLLSIPLEARAQDRASRIVVALSAAPAGAATGPSMRLAQRFAALGLTRVQSLADGIALAGSPRT